jgi:hypothetical protein
VVAWCADIQCDGKAATRGMCAYTFLPRKGAELSEATGGNSIFWPGYMELANGEIVQTLGCQSRRLDS